MYIPESYKNNDPAEIKNFIRKHSFSILVNQVDGKPWATHIPLELDINSEGHDILVGHISKADLQWKHFKENEQVLCIFNGPHSYISSSWYQKEEVPTWNYIAVHVYGKVSILNEADVLASLNKLVDKYEKDSTKPISLSNLSPKTMQQIKGIVGFQIKIDDIQATYKLSQGREQDHASIISELEKRAHTSSQDMAKCMRKNTSK